MWFLLGTALIFSISSTAIYMHRMRKKRRLDDADGAPPRLLTQGGEQEDDVERPLHRCRPEDIVMCEGQDWLVEEVLHLSEGARAWVDIRLADGSEQAWLVVTVRDDTFVGFGRPVELPAMDAPGRQVEAQGKIFSMDRQGTALLEQGPQHVRFWEYQRPGSARLWHRQGEAGGSTWTFLGERLPSHQVTFLPGS
mgnify:CR=1 FL=1